MTNPIHQRVRAAISDSYYDARDSGLTMEHAADHAAAKVMAIIDGHPRPPEDDGAIWHHFGTHIGCDVALEFFGEDEVGEPVWERVVKVAR